MAKLKRSAKRANRHNPREDRNVVPFNRESIKENYKKSAPKKDVDCIPKTKNQESLLCALENNSNHIVVASGPAGTGKTYMSSIWAIKQLNDGLVDKLILVRPNVAVDDRDIGYLPGGLLEKCMHLIASIIDQLDLFYSRSEIEKMLENGTIEIIPLAHIRGRSLRNSVIILEEAQGTTINSILAVMTRIAENTKLIVTGDTKQNDRGNENGLSDLVSKLKKEDVEGIAHIEFNKKDIQRHPIIGKVLGLYGQ